MDLGRFSSSGSTCPGAAGWKLQKCGVVAMLRLLLVWCCLCAVAESAPLSEASVDWKGNKGSYNLYAREAGLEPEERMIIGDILTEKEVKVSNQTLDIEEAKLFAHMAGVAYCNVSQMAGWNCQACNLAGVRDFVLVEAMYSEEWNAAAYIGYFPKNNTKVIVFRGTDSGSVWNWIENIQAYRKFLPLNTPGMDGAYVHTGFHKMWESSGLKRNLTIAMSKILLARGWDGPLVVAGHSLGGALASLCSVHMKYTFSLRDVREYTYGSPRVGNQAFVDAYKRMISTSWRFTHQYDIVPSVPFIWLGYHHVPVEIWQLDVKKNDTEPMTTKLKVCDGNGEDPECHLGACWLGWCRSVSDHMKYLNISMGCLA